MKKNTTILGLVLLLFLVTFGAYAAQNGLLRSHVYPPEDWINANLTSKTFDELVTEADIIARVKIAQKIETFEYQDEPVTKYRAKY